MEKKQEVNWLEEIGFAVVIIIYLLGAGMIIRAGWEIIGLFI